MLVEALRSPDYAVFSAAARVSFEIPGEAATKALATELGSASADKQIVLAETLGTRGDPAALPALFASARNCEKPVRLAAIQAIGQFGDSSSAPQLLTLSGDANKDINDRMIFASVKNIFERNQQLDRQVTVMNQRRIERSIRLKE